MDMKSFQSGREEGLLLAKKIVKEGGLEALEDEIRFRNLTKVKTSVTQKEISMAAEQIKEMCCETIKIAMVAAIHDAYGFGRKRIEKALVKFDKTTAYLRQGWLTWSDMIEDIKSELGMTLNLKFVTEENLGIIYAHPTMEDCYDDPSWVDDNAWKTMLKCAGFKERAVPDEKDCFDLLDEDGEVQFSYYGSFQRIQMYDFLWGVVWCRGHDAEKTAQPDPQPEVKTDAAKRPKRKRKRR